MCLKSCQVNQLTFLFCLNSFNSHNSQYLDMSADITGPLSWHSLCWKCFPLDIHIAHFHVVRSLGGFPLTPQLKQPISSPSSPYLACFPLGHMKTPLHGLTLSKLWKLH